MKYIDTSALIKHYGDPEVERGVEEVDYLLQQARSGEEILGSSFLMIGEAVSVFDKWVRRGFLSESELDGAVSRFLADIQELNEQGALVLWEVNTPQVAFSVDHILKHHIGINDAIHLRTALARKADIDGFICSDQNLKRAAVSEGFHVADPEESAQVQEGADEL